MRKNIGFVWPRDIGRHFRCRRGIQLTNIDVPNSTAPIRDAWHRNTALGLWNDLIDENRSRNACIREFGASLRNLRAKV